MRSAKDAIANRCAHNGRSQGEEGQMYTKERNVRWEASLGVVTWLLNSYTVPCEDRDA